MENNVKVKASYVTDEMVREEMSNIPRLYGATEFGKALGWCRQKVCVYNGREVLPHPAAIIGKRPVWTFLQIVKYTQDKNIDLIYKYL